MFQGNLEGPGGQIPLAASEPARSFARGFGTMDPRFATVLQLEQARRCRPCGSRNSSFWPFFGGVSVLWGPSTAAFGPIVE